MQHSNSKELPDGLEIKTSLICGAGLGVFATKEFPTGSIFGPYKGKKMNPDEVDNDTSYVWEITKYKRVIHCINGKDEMYSNWLRFINCSRHDREQNLEAYQNNYQIYHKSLKEISIGDELLVWYGDQYARSLGIIPNKDLQKSDIGPIFKCQYCMISYCEEKHLKCCRKLPVELSPSYDMEGTSNRILKQISMEKNEDAKLEKPYTCDVCGKVFQILQHFKNHIDIQSGKKQYSNKLQVQHHHHLCDTPYIFRDLERHLSLNTKEKPFKCDICGFRCSEKGNLKKHILKHTKEKPFRCNLCGKQFAKSNTLQAHLRSHKGETPHKCDICDKVFNASLNLKRHLMVHTGERPFKCDVCERGFRSVAQLKRHGRTHTGEKPFKCDVCEKAFRSSDSWKRHQRTHTGEKPYKCDVCRKAFNTAGVLQKHLRIHTGEKPFKCDTCGKAFAESGNLRRHSVTHKTVTMAAAKL